MKSQHPAATKTAGPLQWEVFALPIGLRAALFKESAERLDLALPDSDGNGFTLTFINYKGDLRIKTASQAPEQAASPGLGLLSRTERPIGFCAAGPIQLSALVVFIPEAWAALVFQDNAQFHKIRQILDEDANANIITCRLGRRQMSLFSDALAMSQEKEPNRLGVQNNVLALLEYFLGNRHRSLLGANPASDIENEDDLTLIREVESYISEFYCSDTFTVDSILKKTYTSYHRLNFLFKSIHGMTISEYIRNKRIEKSREMIADNAKSISQIAYEIGYSSISNYILAFKKVYRITPGKYKKQMEDLV
ncbi:MAG TPA: AraC family transcriptional regulator [Puia sp.]|nr:AraC family transcriptional regulator [Puia sp.]